MRPIGFSTGALARGDFRQGIELQERLSIDAVELSALRENELLPLCDAAGSLNLSKFKYVSFHAPSKLKEMNEHQVISQLEKLPRHWPIIVHPDLIEDHDAWSSLGERLCIENMDNRKPTGRTVSEMRELLERFDKATFCLDVGHARQIDPTMTVALMMLKEFRGRLRQVHVSEVGPAGEHLPLGTLAQIAFRRIAAHVPKETPLIIESVITPDAIEGEINKVSAAFDETRREELKAYAYA